MPMALHVAADHRSVEDIHRRKQRRRSIALVIMGHRSRPALFHRQAGLGSVERLNLALLVDGKHDGVRRGIDIEPDHVAQLVDERGIFRQLELPDAVRLEPMGAPDALHGRDADTGRFGHRRARPVRRFGKRRLHGQRHDAFGDSGIKLRDARRPRLVAQEAFEALSGEAFLPAPDTGLGLARLAHDRVRAQPFRAQQDNPRPPDMLLRSVAVADQGAEPIKIDVREGKGDASSHPPNFTPPPTGNPRRDSNVRLNQLAIKSANPRGFGMMPLLLEQRPSREAA